MEGNTILGISPGARYMGIALVRSGALCEWKVRTYKGFWSKRKLNKAIDHIERMVITHAIDHIACKVPHGSRSSAAVGEIVERLKALAEEYKIEFHTYSIGELKRAFPVHIQNKRSLAQYISEIHPELYQTFLRENDLKRPYHWRTFEAIAAGLHCSNKIR